jgi:hypothetical protein
MGATILVLWAMFATGPIHGVEYKSIKYESNFACAMAQTKIKLGTHWNAQCMTDEQWYTFRTSQ